MIKIPYHRVSIAQTMFTYLKSLTTRCFYVVLFSTSWLSLSRFEVVRYGNIRIDEYRNISSSLDFPFICHASTVSLDRSNFLEHSILQGQLFIMQGSRAHRLRLRRTEPFSTVWSRSPRTDTETSCGFLIVWRRDI